MAYLPFRTQNKMFMKSPLEMSCINILSECLYLKNDNLLAYVFYSISFFLNLYEISKVHKGIIQQNYEIMSDGKVFFLKEQNLSKNRTEQFKC